MRSVDSRSSRRKVLQNPIMADRLSQPQQLLKRRKMDCENIKPVVTMAATAAAASSLVNSLVQDELADKNKLSQAKEFHIQGNRNGKVLAYGVEVWKSPEDCRFRIRIYDREYRDRKSAGKVRKYIELSLDDFLRIKRHEKTILRYLNYTKRKETIFRYEDFSVSVLEPYAVNYRPELELTKYNCRMYMNEETFTNMMSYEDLLKEAYDDMQQKMQEDKQFIEEIVNLLAFRRNEDRANDYMEGPAEWYQAGTITTWKKFNDQVSKTKDRLRKKAMMNDNNNKTAR